MLRSAVFAPVRDPGPAVQHVRFADQRGHLQCLRKRPTADAAVQVPENGSLDDPSAQDVWRKLFLLTSKHSLLNGKYNMLVADYRDLQQNRDDLEQECADLEQAQTTTLKGLFDAAEKHHDKLEEQKQKFENQIVDLTGKFESQIAELKSEHESQLIQRVLKERLDTVRALKERQAIATSTGTTETSITETSMDRSSEIDGVWEKVDDDYYEEIVEPDIFYDCESEDSEPSKTAYFNISTPRKPLSDTFWIRNVIGGELVKPSSAQ